MTFTIQSGPLGRILADREFGIRCVFRLAIGNSYQNDEFGTAQNGSDLSHLIDVTL